MGRGSARKQAARPSPMQVVAAAATINVKRLAAREKAGVLATFKGMRVEAFRRETAARNLRLLRVGDAAHGKPERLRNHGQNHGLLLGDNRLVGVQAARNHHGTRHARGQKAAHHFSSGTARMRHGLLPNEIDLVLRLHIGQKVEKYHLTGLDITRHIEHGNAGDAPIAEQHFAALFGALIARLEFRGDHIEPGVAQIFGLFIEIHARANANAGKRLDIRRVGLQRRKHRRACVERNIARQKRARGIAAHSAHNRIKALNGIVGKSNRPTAARKRRYRANLAIAMLDNASFLHAQTQHIKNRRGLVAVRVNAAFVFLEREHAQIFEESHNRFGRQHIHCFLHEFGIIVIGAHDVSVAHVATAVACHEQLLANAIGSFIHMGFSPFSSRRDSARHARRATANNCHFWHTLTSLHGIGARIDDLARLD